MCNYPTWSDLVDEVMRHVKRLYFLCSPREVTGQHRDLVVTEVDLSQLVWNPGAAGEHGPGDEPDLVVAQVDSLQRQTVVDQTVSLVVQLLETVVRQVEGS